MIKEFNKSHIDDVMKIWLETNINAHHFIPEEYWKNNYDLVKSVLPNSTVFIYEENGVVMGFIGITDRSHIAGLFISDKYQSNGIGGKLLEKSKQETTILELNVYAKNVRAVDFYEKHGFEIEQKKENKETNEIEYTMIWRH